MRAGLPARIYPRPPPPSPWKPGPRASVLMAGALLAAAPGWYLAFSAVAPAPDLWAALALPYAPVQGRHLGWLAGSCAAFCAPSALATGFAAVGLRAPAGWRATALVEVALALVLDQFALGECALAVIAHGWRA